MHWAPNTPAYDPQLGRMFATAPWPCRPQCYCPPTHRPGTLAAMRRRGWRILLQPTRLEAHGFQYALDNGAWAANQRGRLLDEGLFEEALHSHGPKADWVVCPDVVGDRDATLRNAEKWLPRMEIEGVRPLIAVQDGMTPADVEAWVGCNFAGIFLGGSTKWKWLHVRDWAHFAHSRGARYHVARVNTRRAVHAAIQAGAHSIDGSTTVRFPDSISLVNGARLDGGPEPRCTADYVPLWT